MLASFVIDRTYSRRFLPKSSSLRTLCLSVEFSDSFRPTSVVSTTYALPLATTVPQPLCNQSVTHSFYLDGGMPAMALPHDSDPLDCLFLAPYFLYFQYLENSFAFFALPKNQLFYFQAIPHSLQKKKTGVGGVGISAIGKFLEIQHGQSGQLSPLHDTPVTSHQSRVTKLGLG